VQPPKKNLNLIFSPSRNQAIAPSPLLFFFFGFAVFPPAIFFSSFSSHMHDLPFSAEHKLTVFFPNQEAAGAALPLHNCRHCSSPFLRRLSLCTQASLFPSPDLISPACNHCEHHLQAFTLCQHNPKKRLSTHPISPSAQPRLINIQNQKPQPALPPDNNREATPEPQTDLP